MRAVAETEAALQEQLARAAEGDACHASLLPLLEMDQHQSSHEAFQDGSNFGKMLGPNVLNRSVLLSVASQTFDICGGHERVTEEYLACMDTLWLLRGSD